MQERIYISGKITGLDLKVAEGYFQAIEDKIQQAGHIPINPMKVLPYDPKLTWKDYMIADIEALLRCDSCFMLDNWKESKGANLEHDIAKGLGLKIYYPNNSDTNQLLTTKTNQQ